MRRVVNQIDFFGKENRDFIPESRRFNLEVFSVAVADLRDLAKAIFAFNLFRGNGVVALRDIQEPVACFFDSDNSVDDELGGLINADNDISYFIGVLFCDLNDVSGDKKGIMLYPPTGSLPPVCCNFMSVSVLSTFLPSINPNTSSRMFCLTAALTFCILLESVYRLRRRAVPSAVFENRYMCLVF